MLVPYPYPYSAKRHIRGPQYYGIRMGLFGGILYVNHGIRG